MDPNSKLTVEIMLIKLQKVKIKGKIVYGDMLADGYYLLLEDDTQVQVPFSEWESYEMEDNYVSKQTESSLDELAEIAQKNELY